VETSYLIDSKDTVVDALIFGYFCRAATLKKIHHPVKRLK
jgi:hypothetical protein